MTNYLGRISCIVLLIGILVPFLNDTVCAATTQEQVHQMAHSVMPFEISKTVHIFKMTEYGGKLQVIVKDPGSSDQIAFIQQHLRHEAERFQLGDYSDPATLHGSHMPGLKELQAGFSEIKVSYTSLPDGAEITFEAADIHLITAIHRWFGSQLSEHGADAKAE